MDEAPGVRGESPEGREVRWLKVKALARLFRLMTGLQKKPCPTDQYGNCYWCARPVFIAGTKQDPRPQYVGQHRVYHDPACPWVEVIEYANFDEEWEARYGRGEARVPEGDAGAAGEGVRDAHPEGRDGGS